ncbi:MAG: ATP-binding protein, partial [Propioniciclava sp.]
MTESQSGPKASSTSVEEGKYDASAIQVLEGLEAVRKRPGMYIGSTGERGLHHLVYEIVDNSVDEALAGYADRIEVTLLPDDGVRVVDNGRGMPVDLHPKEKIPAATLALTVLHAGGKFGAGGYKVSGGLHGVGASVVNALSNRLSLDVRRDGHHWHQSFTLGTPDADLERLAPLGADDERGTTVTFYASGDIFETTHLNFETLATRFREMCFLNKGLTITLRDERPSGTTESEDDLADFAEAEENSPVVSFRYDDGL